MLSWTCCSWVSIHWWPGSSIWSRDTALSQTWRCSPELQWVQWWRDWSSKLLLLWVLIVPFHVNIKCWKLTFADTRKLFAHTYDMTRNILTTFYWNGWLGNV